jgi:uncharacterized iron-regulated membrane protein
MPNDQFMAIVAGLMACSCLSGLALIRRLKTWSAVRWIDHANVQLRLLYRITLLLACVLFPLSVAWIAATVIAYLWGDDIAPHRLIPILQALILAVPLPLAYLLYRGMVAHVRARVSAA